MRRSFICPGDRSKVDLEGADEGACGRSINEVHVEAGFKLNGSIVSAGLADELLVYFAPSLLGEAQGMVHLPALSDLAQAQKLKFHRSWHRSVTTSVFVARVTH